MLLIASPVVVLDQVSAIVARSSQEKSSRPVTASILALQALLSTLETGFAKKPKLLTISLALRGLTTTKLANR